MLSKLRRQVFTDRSILASLLLITVGLVLIWLVDAQVLPPSSLAEVLQAVGVAAVTSGMVGGFVNMLTRKSFADMVKDIVSTEVQQLEDHVFGKSSRDDALLAFWQPFMTEDTVIVVAQDESGPEPTVRSADIVAASIVQQGLFNLYSRAVRAGEFGARIGFVNKSESIVKASFPFKDENLIIIGAPGANPLSNYIMAHLKGVDPERGKVTDGFVFGINEEEKARYRLGPFVVPVPKEKTGIQDLVRGSVEAVYNRRLARRTIDNISEDHCLLMFGETMELSETAPAQKKSFLIIAGHSRYSTNYGARFVLSSDSWASSVIRMRPPVEAMVKIRSEGVKEADIALWKPPRSVIHQSQEESP